MHRWLELVVIVVVASAVARADSPRPKTCPVDYKHAEGVKCGLPDGRMPPPCEYPEGHCRCDAPLHCSGIQLPPEPRPATIWQCTPKVRPDGCPGDQPAEGSACDSKKQWPRDGCDYEVGCAGVVMKCIDGAWAKTGGHGPPPASPGGR